MREIPVRSQARYEVIYKQHPVGEYLADLVVSEQLVVELKCVECFSNEHMAQCLNYLLNLA